MDAKVILVVTILVVWMVLVSASVQAARSDPEDVREEFPRANATRIVVGAVAAPEEGTCDSGRPVVVQHDGIDSHGWVERAVCPNV